MPYVLTELFESDSEIVKAVEANLLSRNLVYGFARVDKMLYLKKVDGRVIQWEYFYQCDNPECPQTGNCGGECAKNF